MSATLLDISEFYDALNIILERAVELDASDIHIEPSDAYRVRFRMNGELHEMFKLTADEALKIISRFKMLAQCDIAEKRMPQDGSFSHTVLKHDYDFRINTCPLVGGEKIVIRILNSKSRLLQIDELGFKHHQKEIVIHSIERKEGLILVCGPTGSGKTTTLYSMLAHLLKQNKNIHTIEDPVEIKLSGINQLQVHNKIGLTFSSLLKTILRQDPDVVMIGEIRDLETAETAIQAAMTGHLIFATFHARDCFQALHRLMMLGISHVYIQQALIGIIAQRLIPKIVQGKTIHAAKRTGLFEYLANDDSLWNETYSNSVINKTPISSFECVAKQKDS